MAKCIAYCTGYDRSREKTDHRLGSVAAEGRAATWETFAEAFVRADGSGHVQVKRGGETIHYFEFPAEGQPLVPPGPETAVGSEEAGEELGEAQKIVRRLLT